MSQLKHIEEDIIDINELVFALTDNKWLIIAVVILSGVLSVGYALSLEDKYKSDIYLAPVADDNASSLAGLASQFGGIASMAGISLPTGESDKSVYAIEVLKSRKFLARFIEDNNLIKDIIAAESWDKENNQILYDSDIYSSDKWVREPPRNRNVIPTPLEAYEEFLDKNLSVAKDDDNGFYRVSIVHYSPDWAQKVLSLLIATLESTIKERDIIDADNSIEYITNNLASTNNVDMKNVFFQLVEKQYQLKMLATVKSEYVFKVIDPAIIPEDRHSPSRALICIAGVIVGSFIAIFVALVRYFWKSKK